MAAAPDADLSGVVVAVTGAGRGLGRALVRRLASHGARVAACSRTASTLESLSGELGTSAEAALLEAVDVTDPAALGNFVDRIERRWGRLDGLINNASILGEREWLRSTDPVEWRRVIDVNLTGSFNACRAVLPLMRRQGSGSIVNVSSGVGDRPRERWSAYAVSKWALEGFSWNLALEEQAAGIRVNVVDPGAMRTSMRHDAYPDENPETLPEPIEVTDVFVWLMHPSSGDTTGQRLRAQQWSGPGGGRG